MKGKFLSSNDHDKINRIMLEGIQKGSISTGQVLKPDELMDKLIEDLGRSSGGNASNQARPVRVDVFSLIRKAHHHAVDLYYDLINPPKRGAPAYSDEHSAHLLELKNQGMSYAEIARKLELDISSPDAKKRSTDIVRKRIKKAREKQ